MDPDPAIDPAIDQLIARSVAGWCRPGDPASGDPVRRLIASGCMRLTGQPRPRRRQRGGSADANHTVAVPPPPPSGALTKTPVPSPLRVPSKSSSRSCSPTSPPPSSPSAFSSSPRRSHCGKVCVTRNHVLPSSDATESPPDALQQSKPQQQSQPLQEQQQPQQLQQPQPMTKFRTQTETDMERARTFLKSLMRVESIVRTAINSSRDRPRVAHAVFTGLDSSRTGILTRTSFGLACRRLQLGLSRTDVDALIALLRSRRNSSFENLKPGRIRWRWFMNHFCGMAVNNSTEASSCGSRSPPGNATKLQATTGGGGGTSSRSDSSGTTMSTNKNNNNSPRTERIAHNPVFSSKMWRASIGSRTGNQNDREVENTTRRQQQQEALQQQQSRQQQQYQQPRAYVHRTNKKQRPSTADNALSKKGTVRFRASRINMKKESARPSSSSATSRSRMRKWKAPRTLNTRNRPERKRPSSVPHCQQRRGGSMTTGGKKKSGKRPLTAGNVAGAPNSLASMASAMQRQQGANWVIFSSESEDAHGGRHIGGQVQKTGRYRGGGSGGGLMPQSPIHSRKRRSNPLMTARLRPFFGS